MPDATSATQEVWAQYERICASLLFSGSINLKKLLKHLIALELTGAREEYFKGEVLSRDVFNTASTLGKTTAFELRKRLAEYYETAGTVDPFLIVLPQKTYRPRIAPNTLPLNQTAAAFLANAKAAMDQRTVTGYNKAVDYIDAATRICGEHPRILGLKALLHIGRAGHGWHPGCELQNAEALVAKVYAQGVEPWEACVADAIIKMVLHWNWPLAKAGFERAILLSQHKLECKCNPWYTTFLACQGEACTGVNILYEAVANAYDSAVIRADLALLQIYAGQFDRADETLNAAINLFPAAHYLPYACRAILYEAKGDPAAALRALNRAPLSWSQSAVTLGFKALFTGLSGNQRRAAWHFRQLKRARTAVRYVPTPFRPYVPASQIGLAAYGAGDSDAAVVAFTEAAIVEHDPMAILGNVAPFMRHLYPHPGFRALITDKIGLALPAA